MEVFQVVISSPLDTNWQLQKSMILATCTAQWNFCFQYSALLSFILLLSQITLLWMHSCNEFFHSPLCYRQLLFFLLHGIIHWYIRLQAKWCSWRDWQIFSNFTLSTFFIMVNAFYPDYILHEISTSMFNSWSIIGRMGLVGTDIVNIKL